MSSCIASFLPSNSSRSALLVTVLSSSLLVASIDSSSARASISAVGCGTSVPSNSTSSPPTGSSRNLVFSSSKSTSLLPLRSTLPLFLPDKFATPPIGEPIPAPAANAFNKRFLPSGVPISASGLRPISNASCPASVEPSAIPPIPAPVATLRAIPPLPLSPPSKRDASKASGAVSNSEYGIAPKNAFTLALLGSVSLTSPKISDAPIA